MGPYWVRPLHPLDSRLRFRAHMLGSICLPDCFEFPYV
uniref:Uncharacterized protein n=1 Tax=Arundo donax TaxID=35708 RepID=A0A0A9HFK7_ARUDO